ncbi:hypothetical protein [Arthrobacter sp. StoSoilB5]|uniref:hypothetical protein n=1 Tax=Arthrobacter sp. StoSoilB5 TaxID=2830992 RepID=UPI001CC78B68|nr:hypothetical protein [Arthrobacter sp. StoSoilB5]
MSAHIRKVNTVSGATAVQIVEKRSGVRRILEHLGSAHDDAGVAALVRRTGAPECRRSGL